MLMRETVLTRLHEGSHWQLLVPERRAVLVTRLLATPKARARPGVVEVTRLRLGEVRVGGGDAVIPPPLVHVAIPVACLTDAELRQAIACPCGAAHADDFTPHGFVVPLHVDDLWPVGEALRLFGAWLHPDPNDWWEEDDEEDDDDDW